MDRAIQFYEAAFGMKKIFGDTYWSVMTIGNLRLGLHGNGGNILGEADQPWGHMLVFEDIDGNVLKLMNPRY